MTRRTPQALARDLAMKAEWKRNARSLENELERHARLDKARAYRKAWEARRTAEQMAADKKANRARQARFRQTRRGQA